MVNNLDVWEEWVEDEGGLLLNKLILLTIVTHLPDRLDPSLGLKIFNLDLDQGQFKKEGGNIEFSKQLILFYPDINSWPVPI